MGIGLYVHIPFCISKCRYCDFNSQVAAEPLRRQYHAAVGEQLQRLLGGPIPYCISTVFFGGGTPTIYSSADLAHLLAIIVANGELDTPAEVSCEANPDTVDVDKLMALRAAGFNRLSLGVQSLDDEQLRLLGRTHDAGTALAAAAAAREAFDNLSLDIIYGIPGQTARSWSATLDGIIALRPDHISAYGLMIEHDTPLHMMVASGQLQPLSDTTYAEFYTQAQRAFAAAGYLQYEISNFARPGYECRHNLSYWRNESYLGCGAGAAAYLDGVRSINIADPGDYCAAVGEGRSVIASAEQLDAVHRAGETIMLALRTAAGADLIRISEQCGMDLRAQHADIIAAMIAEGIAAYDGGVLRLTPEKGFLLHSEVARRFLV